MFSCIHAKILWADVICIVHLARDKMKIAAGIQNALPSISSKKMRLTYSQSRVSIVYCAPDNKAGSKNCYDIMAVAGRW